MRRWQKIAFYFLGAGVIRFIWKAWRTRGSCCTRTGRSLTVTIALGAFLISMITVLVVIWRALRIEGAMVQGMLSENRFSEAYRRLAGQRGLRRDRGFGREGGASMTDCSGERRARRRRVIVCYWRLGRLRARAISGDAGAASGFSGDAGGVVSLFIIFAMSASVKILPSNAS